MLHMRDTRITLTRHANVLPGVVIPEEGMALVYVKHQGETFVQPATGASGELYAGVSFERNLPPQRIPFIREYEVGESCIISLPRTPAAGQISVIENGVVRTVSVGTEAPESGDNVVLHGADLLFAPDSAGRVVLVQMVYVPSVDEARTLLGDAPFGGQASAVTGVIGRILEGEFATSCIDLTKDWTNALEVGLGAGGLFVPAQGNNKVPGLVVKNSPNAANPYLVLSSNVA